MLFYVIFDNRVNTFLTDKNGNLVCCSTIADCIDYLQYVVKEDCDYSLYYSFMLRQRKL